ncbi:MAG: metallophosphoesterase [Thermoproteus sp.]
MLLGVVSDTHDDWVAIRSIGKLFREAGVSAVVHAGDWTSPFSMLKMRRALGTDIPIYTVLGNNEGDLFAMAMKAAEMDVKVLGEAGLIEMGGRRVGVYHGTSRLLVEAMARSGMFDVVIYGHTHRVDVSRLNGALVLNPGEACGCATERRTAALLDLEALKVDILDI